MGFLLSREHLVELYLTAVVNVYVINVEDKRCAEK